jgi:Flp pilus assembly pilin Flp
MKQLLSELWTDEDGLSTVEYAILLALLVTVAAASWDDLGQTLANSADEPIAVMQNATG